MKVYRSPVYPAIQVRLGNRRIRATAGYVNVQDADVETFEEWAAKRPHYKITDEDGNLITRRDPRRERRAEERPPEDRVFVAPGITESEANPEMVSEQSVDSLSVPELRDALREKGLPTTGNRAVLIDRLAKADEEDEDADAEAAIEAADDAADAE
jgi:hypothetical protein